MNNNTFFKPTPLYKEFVILDLIEKKNKITQRYMSDYLNVSVSMVNSYLDIYEDKGYISRKYVTSKTVTYNITKRGIERKKVLNIQYLKASSLIYEGARKNITIFLDDIIKKGFKKILLYGAGEVAEILLHTINNDSSILLEVIAVIDDDKNKANNFLANTVIVNNSHINDFDYDGILVSSYTHHKAIYEKLIILNYDKKKIINFFS
ncbi:MAG: hypothetical protein KQ78_00309 [Candidatus Izimaplasma bacterium HR2]|nr:MAG: hypothetical protein KQ78_00309 [Candidatus Izimaplasma bacterium HR2]